MAGCRIGGDRRGHSTGTAVYGEAGGPVVGAVLIPFFKDRGVKLFAPG